MKQYSVIIVGDRAQPGWVCRVSLPHFALRSVVDTKSVPQSPGSQSVVALDLDNLWMSAEEIESWVAEAECAIVAICTSESEELAKRLAAHGAEFLRAETITVRDWDLCCERLLARYARSPRLERHVDGAGYIKTIEHVAHDLRGPLAVISDYSEILRFQLAPGLTADQERILDTMSSRVGQMNQMIDDLLLTRKTQSGAAAPAGDAISLSPALRSVVGDLKVRGASRRVGCELELSEAMPPVFCDPDHFQRILSNLGSNAIKYSPAGKNVRIIVKEVESSNEIAITFADNGKGIEKEEQRAILERFSQAKHDDLQLEQGFGLGLHIVTELVKQNNGRLQLQSEPGAGSRFTVILPSADPASLLDSFVSRSVLHAPDAWMSVVHVQLLPDADLPRKRLARELSLHDSLTVATGDREWVVALVEHVESARRDLEVSTVLANANVAARVTHHGCWSPVTHAEQLYRCWNELLGLDLSATTQLLIRQQEALQREADRVKRRSVDAEPVSNVKSTSSASIRSRLRSRSEFTAPQS